MSKTYKVQIESSNLNKAKTIINQTNTCMAAASKLVFGDEDEDLIMNKNKIIHHLSEANKLAQPIFDMGVLGRSTEWASNPSLG